MCGVILDLQPPEVDKSKITPSASTALGRVPLQASRPSQPDTAQARQRPGRITAQARRTTCAAVAVTRVIVTAAGTAPSQSVRLV